MQKACQGTHSRPKRPGPDRHTIGVKDSMSSLSNKCATGNSSHNTHSDPDWVTRLLSRFGLVFDVEVLVRLTDTLKNHVEVSPESPFKVGKNGSLIRPGKVFASEVKSHPGVMQASPAMSPVSDTGHNHVGVMRPEDATADYQPEKRFGFNTKNSDTSFKRNHTLTVLLSRDDYKIREV